MATMTGHDSDVLRVEDAVLQRGVSVSETMLHGHVVVQQVL